LLSFTVDNPRHFLKRTPQRITDNRIHPPIASKTAERPLTKIGIPPLQIHRAGELRNQKFPNPLPTLGPFFPSSFHFTPPISRALDLQPTFQKLLEPRVSSPNPVKDAFLRLVASRACGWRLGRRRRRQQRGWRLERREVPHSASEPGSNWEVDVAKELEEYLLKICFGEVMGECGPTLSTLQKVQLCRGPVFLVGYCSGCSFSGVALSVGVCRNGNWDGGNFDTFWWIGCVWRTA
jgi:hypothetical protein